MKKFYKFTAVAAMMCATAFVSNAMDVKGKVFFGCNGNANNFGLVGFTENWEMQSEDGVVFTGTYKLLPVENLQFCFYIIDADYEEQIPVIDDDGTLGEPRWVVPCEPGNYEIVGPGNPGRGQTINTGFDYKNGYWYNDELSFTRGQVGDGVWQLPGGQAGDSVVFGWYGGSISFRVDFSGELPVVSMYTFYDPSNGLETSYRLNGSFTGYSNPSDEWLLNHDEKDPLLLEGTFDIPAGAWEFNVNYGPGSLMSPDSGESSTLLFSDGAKLFNGSFIDAGDTQIAHYWHCNSWPGGAVNVELDLASNEITVSTDVDTNAVEMVEADNSEAAAFGLDGVRVANPAKGLYIINGKKVIK